ncbi:MAG: addiction module protein [Bacteroidota bacterium]
MSSVELREAVHQMINQADDRLLNLVYAMMRADQGEDGLSDTHKELLDERLMEYKNNPESLEDWDDVVKELDSE